MVDKIPKEVKWIKISTGLFEDETIQIILDMPEGSMMLEIWLRLLILAGKVNDRGLIYLKKNEDVIIPYSSDFLATIFNKKNKQIDFSLKIFEKFGMIKILDSNQILISNWEKYQNVDGLEKIREQNRIRATRYRNGKKKLLGQRICQYCGGIATGYDHIMPIARGGQDTDDNKIDCCAECNQIKNDKPLVDFLNNNRDRINDEIIKNNTKLNKLITLNNVTHRYEVTHSNGTDIDIEIDIDNSTCNNNLSHEKSVTFNDERDEFFKFLKKRYKAENPQAYITVIKKNGDYANVLKEYGEYKAELEAKKQKYDIKADLLKVIDKYTAALFIGKYGDYTDENNPPEVQELMNKYGFKNWTQMTRYQHEEYKKRCLNQ